jgi:site-specific DNA-methyltransferase (adenine-specific)
MGDFAMNEGLHLGCCLDLLQQVAAGSVTMVMADLPYGATQNKWDSVIPLDRLWPLLKRACAPNAIIALTASQPFTSVLVMSNLPMFKHEWIWIKNRGSNFANTVREPMKEHESILIFSAGKWTYNKQMQERTGGGASRVEYDFNFRTETENYGAYAGKEGAQLPAMRVPSSWQKFNTAVGLHPTQKPVPLFEYLIKTYTNEGDLVLDCCAGSGTTAIAAINLKRRYLCFERDEVHFKTMSERVEKRLAQPAIADLFSV